MKPRLAVRRRRGKLSKLVGVGRKVIGIGKKAYGAYKIGKAVAGRVGKFAKYAKMLR